MKESKDKPSATTTDEESDNKALPDEAAMVPTGLERRANLEREALPGAYPMSPGGHNGRANSDDDSTCMSTYTTDTPPMIQATLVAEATVAPSEQQQALDLERGPIEVAEVYDGAVVQQDDNLSVTSNQSSDLKKYAKNPKLRYFLVTMLIVFCILLIGVTVWLVMHVINNTPDAPPPRLDTLRGSFHPAPGEPESSDND